MLAMVSHRRAARRSGLRSFAQPWAGTPTQTGWRRKRCVAAVASLVVLGVASSAGAQSPATDPTSGSSERALSSYEAETLQRALVSVGGELEPRPEGKIIERIELVTLEVIEDRDPAPGLLNVLHATTRPGVVKRSLFFGEGDAYSHQRVSESERNLRGRRQLSLALIVPLKGKREGHVRMLVITKDVWSLRLNWSLQYGKGVLTNLIVQPSEENLLGTHAVIAGLFNLDMDAYSVGALFSRSRLAGSELHTGANASLIFNRRTGDSEGSLGSFYYGQPLYSMRTKWSWHTAASWWHETTRSFRGDRQRVFDGRPAAERALPCDTRCVPVEYETDEIFGSYELTRSFGEQDKYDLSIGAEALRETYDPGALSRYDPAAAAAFVAREVPVGDTRIGPFVQLHAHSMRFARVLDLNTLGLQEDYRVGHELYLRIYPALRVLGSSRNVLGSYAGAAYTVMLGDGLVRAALSNNVELAAAEQTDAELTAGAFIASPRLGFGRLIYGVSLVHQYTNYQNERLELGSDTRLRGYAAGAFRGKDKLVNNLEFRSAALQLWSVQLGAAVFYDAGDAFDGFEQLELKHAAGAGLRMLFPQLERTTIRVDWATALSSGSPWPGGLFLSFAQAFTLPGLLPPTKAALIVPQGAY